MCLSTIRSARMTPDADICPCSESILPGALVFAWVLAFRGLDPASGEEWWSPRSSFGVARFEIVSESPTIRSEFRGPHQLFRHTLKSHLIA